MKYFLLLVQERKVKIPAPVWEVVAHAAAAPPPPPPPCLFVVLLGKSDCELRCIAPEVLRSDVSYSLVLTYLNLWAPQISAILPATDGVQILKSSFGEEFDLITIQGAGIKLSIMSLLSFED